MKKRLVELLCCPVCFAGLRLTVLNESESAAAESRGPACSSWCEHRHTLLGPGQPGPDASECTACYRREIAEGILTCEGCQARYPIIGAVPRLVRNAEAEYREFFARCAGGRPPNASTAGKPSPSVFDARSNESFGLQWRNQGEGDRTWFKEDVSLRREEFLYSLAVDRDDLRGALIFDAGCGNGRLTASLANFGAEIVGMELSVGGVEQAQAQKGRYAGEHEHRVHFIQGNVLELPVRAGSFDIIHSSGVLHHTPSVERAFASFLAAARSGGRVYIQLYRRREPWIGVPNAMLRAVTSRLPPRFLYSLCNAAVPLHTALVMLVARLRGEDSPIASASRGERALSLFDNFSPRYQYRYAPEEVVDLFRSAGLTEIKDTTLPNEARHMVAFTARKPVEP